MGGKDFFFSLINHNVQMTSSPSLQTSGRISLVRLLVVLGLGWMFDAMDIGLVGFLMPFLSKHFLLTPAEGGLIGSATLVGMLVGALVAGKLSDRYGRVFVLKWALLLFGLGSMASALAPRFGLLLLARVFTGLGLGAELPVAAAYLNEWAPEKHRGRMVVLLESFWAVGWLCAALLGYLLAPQYGFRVAFALGGLPCVLALFIRRALPESPKWKEQLALQARSSKERKRTAFLEWKGLFLIGLVWMLLNFGYYGMFIWLPSFMVAKGFPVIKSLKYVLLMTLAQLPGYALSAWLIEKRGRRFTLVSLLLGSSITAFGYAHSSSAQALFLWGALLSLCNLGAWGALYAYTPELFPTEQRGFASGVASALGRGAAIFAPWLTGVALPRLGSSWVVVGHAMVWGCAAAVALLCRETKPIQEAVAKSS